MLEAGRHREARQLLQQALGEAPGDPDLQVFAVRISERAGDVAEARRQLANALVADPTHFNARAALYDLEYHAKNYAVAEEVITGLIRENPRSTVLLAAYARLMLVTLHLPKSRALVNEALRIDPEAQSARLVDILLSIVEGNKGRAQVQLEELVADDPDGIDVAYTLLVTLAEERRNREALELARQLLRADPDNVDLVETIIELRVLTHWLALSLWPLTRFGWVGSAAMWAGAVGIMQLGRHGSGGAFFMVFASLYLAYAVYSWVYTPVMTRWVRSRGA